MDRYLMALASSLSQRMLLCHRHEAVLPWLSLCLWQVDMLTCVWSMLALGSQVLALLRLVTLGTCVMPEPLEALTT